MQTIFSSTWPVSHHCPSCLLRLPPAAVRVIRCHLAVGTTMGFTRWKALMRRGDQS
jgi:hypothetical protein